MAKKRRVEKLGGREFLKQVAAGGALASAGKALTKGEAPKTARAQLLRTPH